MFRKYHLITLFFLTIALVVPGSYSIGAEKVLTLKLAHDQAVTTPWGIAGYKFAEVVNKKSNGAIKIDVHPAAQLGDLRELMELTKAGTVDFCFQTSGVAASFVPVMNLFGLPFLFSDGKQLQALYKGQLGRKILDSAEKYSYKGLSFNTYVFRSPMNSKRPLKTPDDFKGLKIRLMQVPIHMDTYRALGASPTAIPFSELYTSAKMGVVDGFENTITALYTQKLYEVAKYFSTLPVFANTCLTFASLKTWNEKLNESQRKIILDCVPESDMANDNTYDNLQGSSVKKVQELGIQVYEGPFDLKAFRAAVKPVYDKWVPTLPPEGQEIVKELQKQWK